MPLGHFYLHVEVLKVDEFINMDVTELSNNEAKNEFFKLLSFPLQGICRHCLKKLMRIRHKNCIVLMTSQYMVMMISQGDLLVKIMQTTFFFHPNGGDIICGWSYPKCMSVLWK